MSIIRTILVQRKRSLTKLYFNDTGSFVNYKEWKGNKLVEIFYIQSFRHGDGSLLMEYIYDKFEGIGYILKTEVIKTNGKARRFWRKHKFKNTNTVKIDGMTIYKLEKKI